MCFINRQTGSRYEDLRIVMRRIYFFGSCWTRAWSNPLDKNILSRISFWFWSIQLNTPTLSRCALKLLVPVPAGSMMWNAVSDAEEIRQEALKQLSVELRGFRKVLRGCHLNTSGSFHSVLNLPERNRRSSCTFILIELQSKVKEMKNHINTL